MPVVDGQVRDGLEGSKVGLLSLSLIRVVWATGDEGSEVAYLVYFMPWEKKLCQLLYIQPTISRTTQSPVIEIEPINIDISADEILLKKARATEIL